MKNQYFNLLPKNAFTSKYCICLDLVDDIQLSRYYWLRCFNKGYNNSCYSPDPEVCLSVCH